MWRTGPEIEMKLGIIGGSGLYDIADLQNTSEVVLETPFGSPSDAYLSGTLMGTQIVFLPRHGRGHRYLPSEINYRANIFGFKRLGVDAILSFSAVGSLREDIAPRDVVLPSQFFDRTKQNHTFFGDGIVAHIPFGDPVCLHAHSILRNLAPDILTAKSGGNSSVHSGGTYVNMEGPAFSTRAESETYRKLGFDVIGMTSLPEAKLCREAGICYGPVALVTDYDCWHQSEEVVNVEMVVQNVHANIEFAKSLLMNFAANIRERPECECKRALDGAVMTATNKIPEKTSNRLSLILSRKQV